MFADRTNGLNALLAEIQRFVWILSDTYITEIVLQLIKLNLLLFESVTHVMRNEK